MTKIEILQGAHKNISTRIDELEQNELPKFKTFSSAHIDMLIVIRQLRDKANEIAREIMQAIHEAA